MNIDELIQAVGPDKVALQFLDSCATDLQWSEKRGSRITFGSDVALTPDGTDKLGIVVWLDRAAVKAALATPNNSTPGRE